MALHQTLSEMMAQRPAVYRALLNDLTEVLRKAALSGVLKEGEAMPDFVLPDASGALVFSDDLLRHGPLAVVFFRGEWCPFCTTTLSALNDVADAVAAAGGTMVALSPDAASFRDGVWVRQGLRFPVLNDIDGAISLQFGTLFRVPDGLRDFYLAAGVDLTVRNGDPSWFLPMPATFIADGGGVLRFAYASGDITDRVEPEEIVARVRALAATAVPSPGS
ncbi:MAG: peroxiredoxin-like family protein [Acetobacteraceae bacterium]|nr:AhpC/TSA family protein [Pseudomonadota bacterium]